MDNLEIRQYLDLMVKTERLGPAELVPIRTYIAHVQHLQSELARLTQMNVLQAQACRILMRMVDDKKSHPAPGPECANKIFQEGSLNG